MEKQMTHHENCWLDGKDHYACAMWKISQLSIELGNAATLIPDNTARENYKQIALDAQTPMIMTNYRE
jgi:hypothetical protein